MEMFPIQMKMFLNLFETNVDKIMLWAPLRCIGLAFIALKVTTALYNDVFDVVVSTDIESTISVFEVKSGWE